MKPILEIRTTDRLTREQHQQMSDYLTALFPEYRILVVDSGMSAHVHDDSILKELGEIRQILSGMYKPITGKDLMELCQP